MKPKNLINISIVFALCSSLFVLNSCEDYERTAEGKIAALAPEISAGANSVYFTKTDDVLLDTFLLRMNWTSARFTYENGLPADAKNLKYTLEADMGDFSNSTVWQESDKLFTDINSAKLKAFITEKLGYESDTTEYAFFRLKITSDLFAEPLYSKVFTLIVYAQKPAEEGGGGEFEIPEVTLKLKKSAACTWENVYVYAWGGEEMFGGWPGKKLTADENGIYSFVVTGVRPISLILNNSSMQFDFINDPTSDACYEITDSSAAKIDCE
jgi:hypothetical protein